MVGFKQFVTEDKGREGELLTDIAGLRDRIALLHFKDQYEAEELKLQQPIKRQKEHEKIGSKIVRRLQSRHRWEFGVKNSSLVQTTELII